MSAYTINSLLNSVSSLGSVSSTYLNNIVENNKINVIPNVDYSRFSNHIFFGDANRKFANTLNNITDNYPIGLSASDVSSLCAVNIFQVDEWKRKASGYDLYILEKLSLENSITSNAVNNKGENVSLIWVKRNEFNEITGSQTAIINSIQQNVENFETFNIDVIERISGSSNDHIEYPQFEEIEVSRSQKLKNMLPEILFANDSEEILERMLDSFGDLIDELKLYIDQLSYLKHVSYDNINRTPNKFLPILAKHYGVELFQSAVKSAFESFFIESSTGMSTQLITYQVWNRIINNLIFLLKSKGTKDAIESISRIYGINNKFLKVNEYSIYKNRELLTEVIDTDVPVFYSSGDVYCQVPTGTVSAFDIKDTYTFQSRISITSDGFHTLLMHPKYLIKADKYGKVMFCTDSRTASNDYSSISSSFSNNEKFYNVAITKSGDVVNVYSILLDESGTSLIDNVIAITATSGGFSSINLDSSAGSGSFGAYFPASGSFNGYIHEIRVWDKVLHENDLKRHTQNFQSISFNSSTSNNVDFSSLKAYYKLRENIVLTGDYNFIVDSTTSLLHAIPVNFENHIEKRYKTFCDVKRIVNIYPNGLYTDNNKVRVDESVTGLIDTGMLGLSINVIDQVNNEIKNLYDEIDIKKLLSNADDLYERKYSGLLSTYWENFINSTQKKNVYDVGTPADLKSSELYNYNSFIKAVDSFNDVLGGIFPFCQQFMPAKSHLITQGVLIESPILERNKLKREFFDVRDLSPTSVTINTKYLQKDIDENASSAVTTASFQGYKFDGLQLFVNNSLTSKQLLQNLLVKNGDSVNRTFATQTRVSRFRPVVIKPSSPEKTELDITLTRRTISPTADPTVVDGFIDSTIKLLNFGEQFTGDEPAIKFNFPVSADGNNLFIATIGDIDKGEGKIIKDKDSTYTTNINSKNFKMRLELSENVRSTSSDVNTLSGELGVFSINVTNLFNNNVTVLRVGIGSSPDLFNQLEKQGGSKILS